MLEIYCKNTGTKEKFEEGISLMKMLEKFNLKTPYRIISAKVNNVSQVQAAGLREVATQASHKDFVTMFAHQWHGVEIL